MDGHIKQQNNNDVNFTINYIEIWSINVKRFDMFVDVDVVSVYFLTRSSLRIYYMYVFVFVFVIVSVSVCKDGANQLCDVISFILFWNSRIEEISEKKQTNKRKKKK